MALNREKLRQAILFFLYHANNHHLGRTKLMKLLYFLDFDHIRLYGQPVTGAEYTKWQYGPVAIDALHRLEKMDGAGDIRTTQYQGRRGTGYRYAPVAELDLSVFTDTELELLQSLAEKWRDLPMDDVVDASHAEYPWNSVEMNQRIPLRSALLSDGPRELSTARRDAIIRSIVSSQALEGVELSYDEVAAIVDDVYQEPLADIG